MKRILAILLVAATLFALASCGAEKPAPEEPVGEVNVYVLTGPTGIGAVNLWDKSDAGNTDTKYNFTAAGAPDEVVAKLSNGEADIAAVSTNLAAKLYKKTEGGIQILAVNTMGVLSVLTNEGDPVSSITDLRGRKVVTTGQGSNPEYIINYLFAQNGLNDGDVAVEFKAEGTELVSVWASEPDAVIIAPAPVSTSILMKYEGSKKALDLTEEWTKCSPDSALMMGCIVARTEFIKAHPSAVAAFLTEYEASIKATADDAAHTGELCEKYGIVAKAAIAAKAIPDCHITFVTGDEMKTKLTGYLTVLFEADASSVGALPDDGFWYKK
ncbi:MAG: ABC transporter substrate-binding protein [Clostridia bacterium]|nr:ABC transporter substrate-binding protein [Clostridia bacterium]